MVRLRGRRYVLASIALVLFLLRTSCACAQDVSVVGTTQQFNDRIQQLGAASRSTSSHEYTIGPDDLLGISVFDVPDLSRDTRVSQSGTIAIPLVPTRIHVAGLTESQAEQVIADVLRANGLVSHPEVGVLVKEHKSRPITVVGAVAHPMVYQADQSVTLLEVLAQAGGVSNDAGDTVIVTRARSAFVMVPAEPIDTPAPGSAESSEPAPGETPGAGTNASTKTEGGAFPSAEDMARNPAPPATTGAGATDTHTSAPSGSLITINLNELLEKGDMKSNIQLQAGDVVTVPHSGIVYVLGAVTRPGGYVMANDKSQMTTMKVLSLAGGLTEIAKSDHAVIVRKDDHGKQTETDVDLKKILKLQSEDVQLHASDVLYIPTNYTKAALLKTAQIAIAVGTALAIYRLGYQ
jgi:protein involved in polysaccharide export with SLBB domain